MDVHPHPGPIITDIHSLDIFHLNSRSIRHKLDNIYDVADDFHVLCFSETHLDPSIGTDALELEGFDTPLRKDRSQHGGGVMVYISNSLKYERHEEFEDPRLESIWLEVKLKMQNILICCFYRSDFNTSQSVFISSMQTSIEMAIDYCPNIILVGDININFIHMPNAQLQDCLSLFNLTNVITEPTRTIGQSSTLIDPILVTDPCRVLDSGVIPVSDQISDHKATYVSLKIQTDLSNSYYRDIWNYKNADYDKLNKCIFQFDWDSVINDNVTVDDACNKFTSIFLEFCKECIPRKKVLIRPNDKPWFNSELRYNIRLRDRLRKKAFKTNNNFDKIRYKRQRNRVNNMKKNAKENFNDTIDDILSNSETGSKSFWQIMGRFMGKSQCSFKVPPLSNADDIYSFSDQDKATTLNDYFCSISTIDDLNIELPVFENRTEISLSHIVITQSEVTDILNTLKVNKATGPDGISHRMLKNCSISLAIPLCLLFNLSLRLHTYPSLWKLAHITPIFKKGDKSVASNYRPISLISCVGKSFERILFKHVYNHLDSNSLIYKYQSGFLPGHSTVHHLIESIHNTCLALENFETSCQVFCDISKAFDRVWHRGLLLKMERYGIRGDLLLWFKSYLENRNQKVCINESLSSSRNITAGVPQGSVLGPLLFLIYINDISENLQGSARLFADDTSLSYSLRNLQNLQLIINDDLKHLHEWARRWLITFNPSKTEVLLISNTFIDFDMQLVMDNSVLKIVDMHKHLGVTLSSNNKWNKHVELIIKSASKQVSYLRKAKYQFSKEILSKLYCTYIRPLLEYASEVWDGCTQTDAYRFEQVQLIAARIVTGLPVFASLNSIYVETGWKTLAERRKTKKLTLMYKIVNNDAPSYLTDLLPSRVDVMSNYNLRNSQNFEIPFARLCSFESSFFPSTLRLWNSTEESIRNAPTLSAFKSNIKKQPFRIHQFPSTKDRLNDIILTRIRHNCSNLNADLFRVNISANSNCRCGAVNENVHHYFLECILYVEQRNRLFSSINPLVNVHLKLITNGNAALNAETNAVIHSAVLKYIKDTHRFM